MSSIVRLSLKPGGSDLVRSTALPSGVVIHAHATAGRLRSLHEAAQRVRLDVLRARRAEGVKA